MPPKKGAAKGKGGGGGGGKKKKGEEEEGDEKGGNKKNPPPPKINMSDDRQGLSQENLWCVHDSYLLKTMTSKSLGSIVPLPPSLNWQIT